MSTVLLCMEAVPHMRRVGGGRIINITSISAKQPIAGLMLSNALRPAVTGFSKTLANELARDGILVNCVAPGYTRTERVVELAEATAAREGVTAESVEKRTVQNIPLGRMAEPSELADLIVYLASDRGCYVTGTTIPVDGGYLRDCCKGRLGAIQAAAKLPGEPEEHGDVRDRKPDGGINDCDAPRHGDTYPISEAIEEKQVQREDHAQDPEHRPPPR